VRLREVIPRIASLAPLQAQIGGGHEIPLLVPDSEKPCGPLGKLQRDFVIP